MPAGPSGFIMVTRLSVLRPRPMPDVQPVSVMSCACTVAGGERAGERRRPGGAASLGAGRKRCKQVVARLGFVFPARPGLVDRLGVGTIFVRAPKISMRFGNSISASSTFLPEVKPRIHLLLIGIDPCREQTQKWAWPRQDQRLRYRNGSAPYMRGSESLVRTLTQPRSELNQVDMKSAIGRRPKPARFLRGVGGQKRQV